MKKLFGSINLTWKKLIIFSIVVAIYTAVMAILPFTKETSFRDIAIMFEWWILFGIIIICNSKSPKDSALKCFVFFLISQPLIYLIQVPFSSMGWNLFGYYRYWFYWTLGCLPMGFIGYYIKKKNLLSVLILAPMIVFLVLLGIGYINSAIESFPHHLLSGIACFAIIIVVVLYLFDNTKLKLLSLGIAVIACITILIIKGGIGNSEYQTYRNIDYLDVEFNGKLELVEFSGTKKGFVEVVDTEEGIHTIIINGRTGGKYSFTLVDEAKKEYNFEYYYDEDQKTFLLELIK